MADPRSRLETGRCVARGLLAIAYAYVGYVHLHSPGYFLPIMPAWVPMPRETILATGACEIAGAIGLLVPRLRRLAGIMLALYALCVWPANMQHALNDLGSGRGLGWWYHGSRLVLQPVIIWWALFAGGVVDWPFRRRNR